MAFEIRPAPTAEQQEQAEKRIDWNKPVGYAHADRILSLIRPS